MQIADQTTSAGTDHSTTDTIQAPPGLVLADACQLNAESMAWCLSAYGGLGAIESVTSAAELLRLIRAQRPALVLIGERIVSEAARELFSELAVRMGETRVAVFANELTDRQLDLLVHNKVSALLSRDDTMRGLNELLLRVRAGEVVLSARLKDRVELVGSRFRCLGSSHLKKLTDRQWDVLLRIAEGRRVSEVARDLDISPKAVESHKYRIMKTLGATDRVDLCRWAIREGLIQA